MRQETENLYLKFKEKAEAVAAQVFLAPSAEAAGPLIAEQLKALGVKRIVLSHSDLSRQGKLDEALEQEGFSVHSTDIRNQAPGADVGISQLEIAVAETGSLANDVTNVDARLVASLPTIHLALVPLEGLTATLEDALLKLYNNGRVPSHLCFTTGPSRTSDIERVLTIGVHGPEKLLIVFVGKGGQE